MKIKISAILLLILGLFICTAYADGNISTDTGIKFVSQSGATIPKFPGVATSDYTMYAQATVTNSSTSSESVTLFVAVYDGANNLKEVVYKTEEINGGNSETLVKVPVTIPKGTQESDFVCKAYLWDSIIGTTSPRAESVFLDLNTELYGITIDGKSIEDYDDTTDFYSVKIERENAEIKVHPKSGATSVSFGEINVPGETKIMLTSGNNRREITVSTYLDELDNYTLSSLSYMVGDEVYQVEGFRKDVYNYTVRLPDNTFYVTLLPESYGEITCKIQDVNDSPNFVNGVSFGKMRTDTTGPAYVYKRDMIDGIIPVKNENTRALVSVTDGENTSEYTITFQAVQPRLTSFNMTGAGDDYYSPVFTSGAGFNNDNGTICVSDRIWAAANISKKLIGASYFMSPYNNKGGGQWWNDVGEEGDEYFNFTADTAGTIYYLGGAPLSEYSDWKKVNNGVAPKHPESFSLGDKTWNDYTDTDYFMSCVKWNNNIGRCDECGVGPMTGEQESYLDGCVAYKYVFEKHFEAGEEVSVKHSGLKGNSAAEVIWAVKWDVDVNHPYDKEEMPDDSDDEEEIETGIVINLNATNNTGEGILDEFTNTWMDISGCETHVTLTHVCVWGLDSLLISTGSKDKTKAVLLGENVKNTINSYNFTLEFELSDIDASSVVAAAENEEFSLCAEKGKLSFYFGGIYTNPIAAPIETVLSGYNTITVSYDSGKNLKIKWFVDNNLIAEKNGSISDKKIVDSMMLGSYNKLYSGDVAIKKFKVYDYVKEFNN